MLSKLRRNKQFLSAISQLNTSLKKWRVIGKGGYGNAYDMGDGRVCKITTNEHETRIALKLRNSGRRFRYLYKVLDVYFIYTRTRFKCGLIITPKYKKLTDSQQADLYEFFAFFDPSRSFRLKSIKQVRSMVAKAAKNYFSVLGYNMENMRPHEADSVCLSNIIERRMKIFRKYDILYMLRNLRDANVGPEDMHFLNILKDKDNYVLIDIGC